MEIRTHDGRISVLDFIQLLEYCETQSTSKNEAVATFIELKAVAPGLVKSFVHVPDQGSFADWKTISAITALLLSGALCPRDKRYMKALEARVDDDGDGDSIPVNEMLGFQLGLERAI
jgi:hypothetical protein